MFPVSYKVYLPLVYNKTASIQMSQKKLNCYSSSKEYFSYYNFPDNTLVCLIISNAIFVQTHQLGVDQMSFRLRKLRNYGTFLK